MDAHTRRARHPLQRLMVLLVGVLLLAHGVYVRAQGPVALSESTLAFRGLLSQPLQRTFTLKVPGASIRNVRFVRHDLLDAQTGVVILSSNLAVTPETREEVKEQESFAVTVSGAMRPGHYTGTLEVQYDTQPANAPLHLTLDVTLQAAPSVDAEANSKSITLLVAQPWLPYSPAGRPRGHDHAVLTEASVSLVQNAEGSAEVQQATVSTVSGAKGRTLPPGVVKVGDFHPFSFTGSDAEHLKVVVAGEGLHPGEYNGTLLIKVRDQAAPVQIPLKVLVKHGPLLALIVLGLGLAAALLFGWWNSEGTRRRDLARSIQRLANDIHTHRNQQAQERDAAIGLLREATALLNAQESWQDAKKPLEAAEQLVTDARTKAEEFGRAVDVQIERTKGLRPGRKVREEFLAKLASLKQGVIQGQYASLDEAQKLLDDTSEKVATLQGMLSKFGQLPQAKQAEIAQGMDDASSLMEILKILQEAGADVKPEPGRSYVLEEEPAPTAATSDRLEVSRMLRLRLSLAGLAVALITYLFTLVVGWVSIYAASDTFGADPKDYITLFLWGAAIEAVRGRTVTLTSLQTTFKEKSL